MARITIGDVAQTAGLSTATVDRALNGRTGVRAANRQRVLEAARELGYLPSEGRMPLPSRPAHLQFLVPFGHNGFMKSLANSISEVATSIPLVASCTIVGLDGIGPEALARAVEGIDPRTSGIGLITTDHPRTRQLIRQVAEAGIRVVTIASDVPGTPRAAYVGVDNRAAGRTAGLLMGLMAGSEPRSIGLFMGSRAFQGHQEREAGFRTALEERFPLLRVLPSLETGEDSGRAFHAMRRLLREQPDLAGTYCVGAGRTGLIQALHGRPRERRPLMIVHDLTETTRAWLREDLVDVVIDQNARLVGEQAVIRLLGSIAATAPFPPLRYIEPRILLRENVPA